MQRSSTYIYSSLAWLDIDDKDESDVYKNDLYVVSSNFQMREVVSKDYICEPIIFSPIEPIRSPWSPAHHSMV